jgi:hypothetical protein
MIDILETRVNEAFFSYLINGDASSLNEDDLYEIDLWCDEWLLGNRAVYFSYSGEDLEHSYEMCEITLQMANCSTITVHVHK